MTKKEKFRENHIIFAFGTVTMQTFGFIPYALSFLLAIQHK